MPSRHDLPTDACPDQSWSDPLAMSVAIDRVMPALLAGISKVRQRVVDLADQEILTVIQTSHRFFHTPDSTAFTRILRPSQALLRKS
jgi:hypothetical protein